MIMEITSVEKSLIDVSLVDASGRTLVLYDANGRYFVEAKDLMEYRIRVRNMIFHRIEVLTAIDGQNTLKNEAAHLTQSRGMVIGGADLYKVKGWRLDDSHTRPFVFTILDEETIAKQATGSSGNLGVIALAAYREYIRPAFLPFNERPWMKGSLEGLGPFRGPGMGTGMGSRVDSDQVGRTDFERASKYPDDIIEIYAMPTWWLIKEKIIRNKDDNFPSGFLGGAGYDGYQKIN